MPGHYKLKHHLSPDLNACLASPVIGNASEGKYNTVNNSSSGKVTLQKCLNSGITLFSYKNSYMKLGHAA